MALIGKIRNNSWLLILTLGLALAAFIIMDMTSANNMGGGASSFSIGTVAGEDIDWRDFQRAEDILYSGSGTDLFERREFLWNYFVEKTLLDEMAEDMGLGVGEAEMEELQYGNNLSPVVAQRFMNPNTGQIDRAQLNEIRQGIERGGLEPSLVRFWMFQEQEVQTQRLQDKLGAIVRKGIYTPTWLAEEKESDRSTTVSIDFLNIPFSVITDNQVEVSDRDLRNFMTDHRKEFEREEEARQLAYIAFDVLPTAEDSSFILQEMRELVEPFYQAEDDSAFVDINYGNFDVAYYHEDELSPSMANRLYNMEIGEVSEPFIDENSYKLVKLIDRKMIPDSVRSRHILRTANSPGELRAARELVDSLKNLIEQGVQSFDSLAVEFGTDATADEGGDLGYTEPGAMVQEYNDLIFYKAEPGQLYTITSRFGVHLVEVTDQIFSSEDQAVRFASVEEPIMPSEETQNMMYDEILNFISDHRTLEDLEARAEEDPSLFLETSNFLNRNDYSIQGLGANSTSRDIIRWMFSGSASEGSVSPEIYGFQHPDLFYTEKYVVAALQNIESAGLPSVDGVRNQLLPRVMNEKKGEIIASEIEGMDLQQIAGKYNLAVEQANDINLAASFIPGIGNEPAVLGALKLLRSGQQSKPIIGNSAVFSLAVNNRVDPPAVSVTARVRSEISAQKRNQVNTSLMESIKEKADIEDQRYNIY